jgi:superfamily II DNA/RNA helicase
MKEILAALPKLRQKILTSATQGVPIPDFVGLRKPFRLDFIEKKESQLSLKTVLSPSKDKLSTLLRTLCHLGDQSGIVFCNFRDSIERVSDFLHEAGVEHGCFHGGMEQQDRERALLKFRNGTYQLLLATDLAARGIDIPEINFIIHYHLPNQAHEFTHRNGRTARMNRSGYAYVLQWEQEFLPDFIQHAAVETLQDAPLPPPSPWTTLFLSGGRKDSISKGDIVGLCLKQGQLDKGQLGKIEIKQDCAFAAVWKEKVPGLLPLIDQTKLKKKKIRVREV